MATAKQKAQYSKPASQVDLEERLENGNRSNAILSTSDDYVAPEEPTNEGRDFRVEDNDVSGYVGTSPEYATYANDTEAPLKAKGGAENEVFDSFAASPVPATLRVEGNVEYEGEVKSKEAAASSTDKSDEEEDELSFDTPDSSSDSSK